MSCGRVDPEGCVAQLDMNSTDKALTCSPAIGKAVPPGSAWPWLAVAIMVGVLLVSEAVHAPDANARPLKTGISDVFDNDAAAFEHVRYTGARLVQAYLRWKSVAPDSEPVNWNPEDPADPNYDWEAADIWVTRAVQAGLVPVLTVYGAPTWAQRCTSPSFVEIALCDPSPAALAAFATAAAKRYSGHFAGLPHVRYWQGLNEPNLSLFFNPQFVDGKPASPALYRTLINAFYSAVKSVDPSNLVLAAGLGPIAVRGYTIGPMQFTRELLCMRGRDHFRPARGNCHGGVHFDIFDIHPYTTGSPTHKGGVNDVELGGLPKLKALLSAADRAKRIKGQFRHTPLWVTEFGWDSNPPDPGGLPMKIEMRWTAEALHTAWRAGVSNFFWFSLRDFPPEPNRPFSETLQTGLYFRGATVAEDQPKEVLYAFRFPFVAYPRKQGLFFWGRTPNSQSGKVVIQIWKHGHWRKASVARADKAGIFRGVVRTRYGSDKRGSARAVYHGQTAIPFSMRPVADFYQPPFGK